MGAFNRAEARERRKKRVRKKIKGTPERPRLCVFRSLRHIYAQIIDDTTSTTLVEASSVSKGLREKIGKEGCNKKGAALVGKEIAERALKKGIKKVVFDRNGFLYHGRVKALSEAAREGGLEF
ncbi:MAG: 50S ribosomal protein L18 [Deltaproteobacteria bacterium]|nr:50S ribosomal protein L18 [Deltaproteobacteria bacterium]MBW1930921.1 50S ribosomal protein L18 [Deltaproteobacteria bacterium]MBW2024880.1 50S ribosomal protein L18 [Deltaproteobacteria bacterium]MBW2125448.1 50S ribosomal protein L18 [Deltaproteobacteria bacterium]RLB19590.1 MAG: 50S ribosomal protein L18 [Deltaproteobacteria bacterium]